ncbi:YidB family protein [Gluconobacter morbifer]|nr:hypothetical protein [Gluconobacter morbifer]
MTIQTGTPSETQAQKATSAFVRFGDWLSGASTDRSGLTEVTIRMMKDDCRFAETVGELGTSGKKKLSPQEVQDIMGEGRLDHLSHQTGQSPEALETALQDVLPMLGTLLHEDPDRLFKYMCQINPAEPH